LASTVSGASLRAQVSCANRFEIRLGEADLQFGRVASVSMRGHG
jgi:hypothetical protein